MNITDYILKIGDNETTKQITLSYYGNENIFIDLLYYDIDKKEEILVKIELPRMIVEKFLEMIK